MAVTGLQNVSVLDSSFRRESQSPLSRPWGTRDRPSTQASSLLQMWRELEGEHVVTHSQLRVGASQQLRIDGDSFEDGNENANGCRTWSQGQMVLQNEHDDGNSSSSEQSTDLGEVERGRVRQIFQELTNSEVRGHSANVSSVNNYSRAVWLGENECGRVGNIREWVHTTSQQRGTCAGGREEQPTEGAQIGRIPDGFIGNHCETIARRKIRRLCGRQALIDLLARAERERKTELQNLLQHRPVSDFAHRNRIQSLLRGRFLQSGRLVQDERRPSVAASELGILRERHTVSGLREGFISRVDNFVHCPSSCAQSDTSSNNDIMNEQTQTNSLREDLDAIQEQSEPYAGERGINESQNVPLEGNIGQDVNWQEASAPEQQQVGFSEHEESEELQPSNCLSVGRRDGMEENAGGNWGENIAYALSQETSGNDAVEQQHPQLGANEVLREQYEPREEELTYTSSRHANVHESSTLEGMHWPHASAREGEWQEAVTNYEDSDWQQPDNIELSGWRDDNAEGIERNWSEGIANDWYHEILGSEVEVNDPVQELHEEWPDNELQEAMDNLLEGHSARQAAPVGGFDTSYSLDDDNVYSSEIRELLSRRSVSNLLRSDFRGSLDHLIQSYVERQARASVEWEVDGTSPFPSPPTSLEQEVQESGGQNQGQPGAAEMSPFFLPSPPVDRSQPFWDQELRDDNWPQNNLHQRLGIDWEIINDLRIDMARLQQRMNNMQRMLEACMDMQLELQRSVCQEVSATLNRSAGSTDGDDGRLQMNESKWDHVRKGLCCICAHNSIDSLLYRCGHMCTCSKCADKLVQGRGNCPMCRAPVVEMIRAYAIQ